MSVSPCEEVCPLHGVTSGLQKNCLYLQRFLKLQGHQGMSPDTSLILSTGLQMKDLEFEKDTPMMFINKLIKQHG